MKLQFEYCKDNDLANQLNYIKWLDGQFKFKLNSYYSCLMEKAKLTFQVYLIEKY